MVLHFIKKLGYENQMTGHGFRSLFSTWANDRGYNEDVIEMQLAHTSKNLVRSTYNRAKYLPQRTKLLQDWADWLFSKDPQPPVTRGTTNASSDSNARLVEELAPH
jgi:integrase